MLDADLIKLDPEYQRGAFCYVVRFPFQSSRVGPLDIVWNDQKQMNLIDSLVHNYPVPNLVFCQSAFNQSFVPSTNDNPSSANTG